jgi:undecaprenyl diphosphate synthase
LPRSEGHKEGRKAAKRIVLAAEAEGVDFLSLYVFSTENWKRTTDEVGFLMALLKKYLIAEYDFYRENRVKVVYSGDPSRLDPGIVADIRQVEKDTAAFDGICVNMAINYGGRDEIVRAARRLASQGAEITDASLRAAMDRPELPDPDLIIRTAGELRLSNFLLWQSAYSELWFSDKYWPDFYAEDLREAITAFASRDRRFGGRP